MIRVEAHYATCTLSRMANVIIILITMLQIDRSGRKSTRASKRRTFDGENLQ